MDQDEFRQTYRQVNECYCAYEKGILTNQCQCSFAERFCIAEREGVHCRSEPGQQQCLDFLEILREQAKFALRTSEDKSTLPHGKAIKIQIGGLRGAQRLMNEDRDETPVIKDVHGLLNTLKDKYKGFANLPFNQIMQDIANYKVKTRSRRRR